MIDPIMDDPFADVVVPLRDVSTLPLVDLKSWIGVEPQPKAFIMPGYVPARELTLLTGAGGANKSTFGQQLATCVAAGVPMLGIPVERGTALYITAEDDADRLHWMQAHISDALGADLLDLSGRLHLSTLRGRLGNELATFDHDGHMRPSKSFAELRGTIEATNASLVVLDNAAHMFAGNENDRVQVTAFVNLLYSLCTDLGVSVVLVAHSNKAGDTYSGSTAWLNAVRSQIVLTRPAESHDPDERVLTLGKANYARQGDELRCRWHQFALIRDEDLPTDQRETIALNIAAAASNAAFLACLRARVDEVGPSRGWSYAPAVFEKMPEARGFNREALTAAMNRLRTLGQIEVVEVRRPGKGGTKTVLREVPPDHPPITPPISKNTSRSGPDHPPEQAPIIPRSYPRSSLPPTGGDSAGLGAPAPSLDPGSGADQQESTDR